MTQTASNSPDPTPASRATTSGAPRRRANIEVVIPTFNEELNLPHALASVCAWADAVYVVDSESTDRTRRIAEEFGARVVVRPWLGYARQKNWALENLPLEADWVFILDADESITPRLRDELMAIAMRPAESIAESGFYVNRLTYFLARAIRHCGYYPSYNLRFFKRGRARYEDRDVHEHMLVDGSTARLTHDMLHEDRRGLEHFIAKHNRYSTLEARELMRGTPDNAAEAAGPLERGIAMRRWLKRKVLPHLPFSGLWRFFYMYVLRLGFLDGITGFRFCLLLATYDTLISLKLAELRSLAQRGVTPVGPAPRGLAVPEGQLAAAPAPSTVAPPTFAPSTAAPSPVNPAPSSKAPPPVIAPGPAPSTPPPAGGTHASSAEALAAAFADIKDHAPPTPEPIRAAVGEWREKLDVERPSPGDWPPPGSVPVSILVPVKNEQRNIAECLRRVRWAGEIVVVDSASTDPTVEMSQAFGADVYQFRYNRATGWPKKKNWALANVPWKHEWVMILDADEYMTPELAQEIRAVVLGQWKPTGGYSRAGCGDGYWVNRRFMFMTRWLKGCGYYPSWNVRLFKHALGRYERIGRLGDTGSGDNEVHEHVLLSTGEAGYLRHEFLHYAYPDLSAWIEKHNRYTTWEAHAMEAKDEGAVRARIFGQPIERRRWLKRFGRKLPFRPTLRFLYAYVAQSGFLDGYPGFVMCRLLAWYELMSIAKFKERGMLREAQARGESQPGA